MKKKAFYVLVSNANNFSRGMVLKKDLNGEGYLVLKTFRDTKFRRFLKKLGFRIRLNQLKITLND